ncbi:MAG TPA: hypothetical protein VI216_15250 [Candidatus Acidoferrales bacterium]
MPLFTRSLHRAGLIGGAALALSLVPLNARGQEAAAQSETTAVGQQNSNANLNGDDAGRMDQFLDDHKDIDKDLKKDPSLVTNKKYLDHHKELRSFLQENPRTQGEFARNPDYFTRRQDRVGESVSSNNPQDVDRDRDRYGNGQNPGQRTGEVAKLDQFLDSHQQIDRDLTANPSLANNNAYLDQHQDLRTFLNDHPDLREQFAKNPTFFMQRQNQFDAREAAQNQDQDRDRNFTDRDRAGDRDANRQDPNPDLRNWEVARMDQFLDDHQPIEKDLMANPSLVNDQRYLASHRDLQLFLNAHPQVREEFAENPTYFMNQENRFEVRENTQSRTGQNVGQPNTNANPDRDRNFADRDQGRDQDFTDRARYPDQDRDQMDQFLGDHKDIDKDLRKNPSLVNDRKYLGHHKDLRSFFNEHPQARQEFAQNPSYFMGREERFEGRERVDANRSYSRSSSNAAPNLTDKQAAQMDRFLDKHKDVDRDLSANPSLCKNEKYLNHHKELRAFLNKNPEVRTQLAGNSSYFAERHERMEEHHSPVDRAKTGNPAKKPARAKTPIEQHETTTPATPH